MEYIFLFSYLSKTIESLSYCFAISYSSSFFLKTMVLTPPSPFFLKTIAIIPSSSFSPFPLKPHSSLLRHGYPLPSSFTSHNPFLFFYLQPTVLSSIRDLHHSAVPCSFRDLPPRLFSYKSLLFNLH